uniref:AlNc14C1G14 protein n=1 Tax=Albugo laibachii Nc14 TaxID=890382 RepID=F0VYK7_9STRA|nr:AlNc14C1G14 [Albugo laibachii Nc14]|eukprot:CCA13871.1 AlNc14C1G14 [Albugo laibachii Nc14]
MTLQSSTRVHPQIDSNTPLPDYYSFEPCDPLPKVDPSRCWVSFFISDERRLAKCVSFLIRAHPYMSVIFIANIYVASVSNVYANSILCVWTNITVFIATLLEICSWWLLFSIDITKLIIRTYEFWYLTVLNVGTQAVYIQMTKDVRVLFFFMAFVGYQGVFFSDANVYFRRQELVLMSFVAPACVFMVATTQVEVLTWSKKTTYRVGDALFEDGDLALGALIIIVLFLLVKVAKSKDLMLRKEHTLHVHTLQMYRAAVTLRKQNQDFKPNKRPQIANEADLHLHMRQFRIPLIDSSRILSPQLHLLVFTHCHRFFIQCVGYIAVLLTAILLLLTGGGYTLYLHNMEHRLSVSLAFVLTFFYTGLYVACSQKDLIRLIITSGEAFVSQTQQFIILVCACDGVNWDFRVLLLLTIVLWGNFNLFMDAVTPNVRPCLGFQQWFSTMIAWFNSYSILALMFWFFIRRSHGNVSDHLIYSFRISEDRNPVELHVSTILASQLFGALFWSLRLTYSETVRRTDVLKIIEATVQCRLTKKFYRGVVQIPSNGPPITHVSETKS